MAIEDDIFELKFASRRLSKLSSKAARQQSKLESEMKLALVKQDVARARIHAESAIRKKNESVHFLRLASKLDAVVANLKLSAAMHNVSGIMGGVAKSLGKALDSNELEKVTEIMDRFERQCEELNIQHSVMEESMTASTATLSSSEEVESLMRLVAEESGLDVSAKLADVPIDEPIDTAEQKDNLSRRLAALRE